MKRYFAGLTDTGLVRAVNQDAYYIDDSEGRFFIVADGMGGHAGGQEASRIATETIQTYLIEHWDSPESSEELLKAAFLKANEAIIQDQLDHPERSDMGTTAVAVIFRDEDGPWCSHIGDSRLYRLRGANLEQITEDHTWVARALKAGHLTSDEVRTHPWRHVLSQCLGRQDIQEIEVQRLDVQPGDRLLLCSDGLTEELSDKKIESILKSIRAGDQAVKNLVSAAKDKGGRDNITAIAITLENVT
ncbi:Stp1/IreP family PP2C-type Ser/Thr phosphatase [Oxynema aestuarii]|jgi:serine/threonine protein phosphatase PrpC|uniref:Stp1/IreP family PP2C-type Ser/Thr phosphatase n=1 Tax=Oxynema aestuarii AP17 TaxID=2064643 RepID=A0A6H1U2Z6_9CYAN|nr:Stp1/IreP family PP2C-type Ser/Thr phosphatase [Oxynema aestuarii]QIZ73242.1 Stp1/IreP family PP2C-type Ser/Thr phosphatase [Oxynema aestuarii AP17]RMH76103.1 MAG: Stp1/IreP family PP2C-type Ser/Thr phosphatase [Cyanobacteria bacterium J007]